MARKQAFTPASIDALLQGKLGDSNTPGPAVEVLSTGRKRRHYRRQVIGRSAIVKLSLGLLPAHSIADARAWAGELNEKVEAGIDSRDATDNVMSGV